MGARRAILAALVFLAAALLFATSASARTPCNPPPPPFAELFFESDDWPSFDPFDWSQGCCATMARPRAPGAASSWQSVPDGARLVVARVQVPAHDSCAVHSCHRAADLPWLSYCSRSLRILR